LIPKYVIAYPFGGRPVPCDWHLAVWSMLAPTNSNSVEIFRRSMPLDIAQESMAQEAVRLGAEYILFIEDDTEPPVNAIVELGRVLETSDAMACGGIYTTRTEAPEPIVYMGTGSGSYWNWKVGDVFPCWSIGAGCLMIRTKVFELMPKPWFRTLSTLEAVRQYPDLFPQALEREWKNIGVTSDIFFCTKLAKHGYKVMAHGGVLPKHWDMERNVPCVLPENSYPLSSRVHEKPCACWMCYRNQEMREKAVEA
jgi:hypothetical protein